MKEKKIYYILSLLLDILLLCCFFLFPIKVQQIFIFVWFTTKSNTFLFSLLSGNTKVIQF